MHTSHHQPPSAKRRWGLSLIGLILAATATAVASATPAHAAGSFCNTATSVYTGVLTNAYTVLPASNGTDGINCFMSRSATGGGVRALQQSLNRCYGGNLTIDGQFGPRTQAALTRAQQSHGITSNLGKYTDHEPWTLKFMGFSGLRLVCARIDGPMLG